jgi:galactokinase
MSIPGLERRLSPLASRLSAERSDRDAWTAWYVPGRIEVLGKHTDYAGGRSLLAAVERGICCIGAPRTDGRLSILDATRHSSVLLEPERIDPPINWATYPLTVLRRVNGNFPGAVRGADLVFDSDLPSASGLSSSSALMIAVLLTLRDVNQLDATAAWSESITTDEDLAAYAATIENGSGFRALSGERGVGTLGGSEDHTAILCSTADRIAQYSFRPTRRERTIPFPADWTLAIGVSGVRAQKTGNAREAYNRASAGVAAILSRWRDATGRMDETLAAAVDSLADAGDRIRRLLRDEPALLMRFDQFLEESITLVPEGGDQLARGDLDAFGATVARSQDLAERLLGNQVAETIALVRLARKSGAAAASAFGAGFGGSVWALVERRTAHDFLKRWQNAYHQRHADAAVRATFFLSAPGPAAARLSLSGL